MTDEGAVRQLSGGVAIPELVRRVLAGSSAEWHGGAAHAGDLSMQHAQVSDRGRRALTRLESAWTGSGADAARDHIMPAVEATYQASSTYESNARTLTDTAGAFDRLKSEVVPMPDQPPTRGLWDSITPWDTDTEDEINQYRELEQQNRRVYEAYEQYTRSASGQMINDYGQLDDFGSDDASKDTSGFERSAESELRTLDRRQVSDDTGTRNTTADRAETDASRDSERSAADSGQERDALTDERPGSHEGSDSSDPSLTRTHPGGEFTGGRAGDAVTSSSSPTSSTSSTSLSGYQPPADSTYRPSAYQPSQFNPAVQPVSTGSQSPLPIAGGAPVGGSGTASGSGVAAGGVRPGAGPAGGTPGAGRGSGAAPFGSSPSPAQGPNRPGAGGPAGRAGAAPMGAMGGAGGRGQGTEDSEHQRNYVQDTDEAFSFDGDDELRDPQTGQMIMPPTIGE
ncbi:hypothetical protein SAXI111661_15985 [Saccharomonospora xinjiangensis]|uniref:hypothetical protein n=1 Tax=Saccharomonospora xinjiangensis TaxID=75294 RepID=UPI00106F6FD9|nr:hypothetical protein [Saccharomonospora xinjiangensis]QBQ62276.1 hypothetical protein EYD13_19690 [Saccharomonospora xinjiangensis]